MTNSAQGYQGGLQGRGDIGDGPWRMSRVYQEKKKNTAGKENSRRLELRKATAMSRKKQVECYLEQGSQSWSGIKSPGSYNNLDIV